MINKLNVIGECDQRARQHHSAVEVDVVATQVPLATQPDLYLFLISSDVSQGKLKLSHPFAKF